MRTLDKIVRIAVLACAALILVPSVSEAKIYAGASLGESSVDFGVADIADGSLLSSVSVDDSDSGEKLYAGFTFFRFVAVEAGLVDLGEFSVSATSDGTGSDYVPGSVGAQAAVDGILVSVIGRLPLGKFVLFAKAGYFAWDADLSISNGGSTASGSDDGEDEAFGAGVSYRFIKAFSVRLEYEVFDIDGTDVDFYSAGIGFRW